MANSSRERRYGKSDQRLFGIAELLPIMVVSGIPEVGRF